MRQRGFTYLAVIFAVAIIGTVLASTAVVWHVQVQRDKEQELLFIGHAYRQAIAEYYEKTPGTAKQFPKKLEDLLEDKRQVRLARYLRKLYWDPMTGSKEWGVVNGPGETIIGVYSRSQRAPIKSANFEEVDKDFAGASNYADWKFVLTQPAPATPAATLSEQTPGSPPPPPRAASIPPPAAAKEP